MNLNGNHSARRTTPCVLTLTLALLTSSAIAQTPDPAPTESKPPQTYQTLYLISPTDQRDANDMLADLRNMLPRARVFYVPSQNAISMLGTSDDFLLAKQILSGIDRARKVYRLTYTITQTEKGQPAGTQHVALIVASGERADLKQGTRIPIVTGTVAAGASTPTTQVQYVDVGLKIEASLAGTPDDLRLRTKVEQSSIAEEKSSMGPQDPVIRQTTLEGMSTLAQGKPFVLGSLDIPGTTRHMEIAVSSEPLP
jgi:type II secretory pathway component GspD/PulD (secretin)